jgi:hypothetical protein
MARSRHHARRATPVIELPSSSCIGRDVVLAALDEWLAPHAGMVWWLYGIGGIGKTQVARALAARAAAAGRRVAWVDGQVVEPSPRGVCEALSEGLGIDGTEPEQIIAALAALPPGVLIVFDTFERCRPIDAWLRQSLVPALPVETRLLVVSRDAPVPQWALLDPPRALQGSTELAALSESASREMLSALGMPEADQAATVRFTQGHPLALRLAAGLTRRSLTPTKLARPMQPVLDALVQMLHAEVADPILRQALHRAAVVRRVTVSLLRALLPQADSHALLDALAALPMCTLASDGLLIHDTARAALAAHFKAIDPAGHREARRAAWQVLHTESLSASRAELWRYTADLLYLVEAPSVREVFFPSGSEVVAVEAAKLADEEAVMAIAARHAGPQEVALLRRWWHAVPDSFRVTRDAQDDVSGYLCAAPWSALPKALISGDPLCSAWSRHLDDEPVNPGEQVLVMRSKLCAEGGEALSPTDAALTMDLKRAYVELRPKLRRLYTAVLDETALGAFFRQAGFRAMPECAVTLDGRERQSLMLDFGPGSVDGWLSQLVAVAVAEGRDPAVRLDAAARELFVDGQRVALTALEFELLSYLVARDGEAVKRGDLLDDVWGSRYEGGSNVIDVVIRSLRRKLGVRANSIETVPRFGYRYRRP